jgi:hypothetical protein
MPSNRDDDYDDGARRPVQRRGGAMFWVVPTLTFVVGLLLGGLVVGMTGLGFGGDAGDGTAGPDGNGTPAATATTPGPTEPGPDRTVTIPAECLEVADTAERALDLSREAAGALGQLDARRLQEIVDELQALEPELTALAGTCREADVVGGDAVTVTRSASPSATGTG